MSTYDTGLNNPYDYLGVIPVQVFGVAINFYANRTPLVARLPKSPVGSLSFKVTNDNFRPRSTTINHGGGYNTTDASIVVADGTFIREGDVLESGTEQILVTGVSGSTLTVTRSYASTTPVSPADASTIYVIGNTRTGAEVDVVAISRVPSTVTQNLQNFQHAYQVGGALNSATEYALPPGVASVLGRDRAYAMQNCMDDIENACYYGKAVTLAAVTTRPQMTGLRTLISTNNTTSPTNSGAYTPADFIRDTIAKAYQGGGNPDKLIVSTDFMTGLSTWGHAVQRLQAGATLFGTPIDVFEAPFIAGVQIVPAPLLRSGTAICLSSGEVRMRVKRAMFDKPRGSRGDADEGDIIAEMAIELDNEAHHAYVSGITAFSAA